MHYNYNSHSPFLITAEIIKEYTEHLREEERAKNTIDKYIRDIRAFASFLGGEAVTKDDAINWKESLRETHGASSINSMLAAINGLFAYFELGIKVKALKVQKNTFVPEGSELTREEYERLLEAARAAHDDRLYHMMATMCATGIRVSELEYIRVSGVQAGMVQVTNKGKTRVVLLPSDLREELLLYIERQGIERGCVFVTKGGKPVNRSNIWAEMKRLCAMAGVDPAKVYPHALRRLFSREVHGADNDIAILSEILGHSDINTTRVYIRESTARYRRIIDSLGLARMRYTT